MPAKKIVTKTKAMPVKRTQAETTPKFPYTNKPGSLRKFLKEIPKKPKPAKFDKSLLRGWGFADGNDYSILRVIKAVGLINDNNEPTDTYAAFMRLGDGAKVLAPKIRSVYAPFFEASHAPYAESAAELQSLFNIHSGGGERTLEYQIQTFKALCENADFDGAPESTFSAPVGASTPTALAGQASLAQTAGPAININVHIHLPENKTTRDYEAIIEDIGKYIFGRTTGGRRE